jgi:hypothetical protein
LGQCSYGDVNIPVLKLGKNGAQFWNWASDHLGSNIHDRGIKSDGYSEDFMKILNNSRVTPRLNFYFLFLMLNPTSKIGVKLANLGKKYIRYLISNAESCINFTMFISAF